MKNTHSNNSGLFTILKATLFCTVFTVLLIVLSWVKNFLPGNIERLSHGLLGTVAALLATFLFLRVDNKSFSDIGLKADRGTLTRFFKGVLAGTVLMGFLVLLTFILFRTRIEINPAFQLLHFLWVILPLLPLAYMEELGFRAYPLEILKDKTGIRTSILVTSVLFAAYHIVNGWSVTSSFTGPAIWGIVFGVIALYSKGIAMPTGLHFAANLVPAAFAIGGNSSSIWILQQPVNSTKNDLVTLIPNLVLLVIAVLSMEIYIRSKKPAS